MRRIEGLEYEIGAKEEIVTGYTAAGFPEAAEEMEENVSKLRGEVSRLRRLVAQEDDELLDLIGVRENGAER